ncbi:MAG TPA: hypothetical protein VF794_41550 [Archangium sp.]|jgi:hypothetical protein|uniref:hypothetical protein n=1 Tax=Archangium sp. TaxID=1872627 RepID=UPI002ED8A9C2
MRPSPLVGSALLALTVLGCTPSPQEVCHQMTDQLCERNFACRTDKDTAPFQYVYGANVDECKAKFYAANGCGERTEEAQNCVGPNAGKSTFHMGEFADCQDALNALSCQEYVNQQNDPKLTPAICRQICD